MNPASLARAAGALRKLGGTYVSRHAEEIARLALGAGSDAEALNAVEQLVGGTSVGRRRYADWARVARQSVGLR